MKPLVKWPGGKSRELKYILPHLPKSYSSLVSPFVGGGALFFALEPNQAFINDVDDDLISFYENVKYQNRDFHQTINSIIADWELLEKMAETHFTNYLQMGKAISSQNGRLMEFVTTKGEVLSETLTYGQFSQVIQANPTISLEFADFVSEAISNKLKLTNKMQNSSGKEFDRENHYLYFETALKSAYYTYIRDLHFYSQGSERAAYFYFLREFCFGSMFRFNSEGKFNIPYGGINYNRKNFKRKVDALRSRKTISLLQNTVVHNLDFADFLQEAKYDPSAFAFFDPPYDTTFSDYSMNAFTRKDQERLADTFEELRCKGLMVTKETEFIRDLYTPDRGFKVKQFEKTYAYNMRGRNDRKTTHLVITNY